MGRLFNFWLMVLKEELQFIQLLQHLTCKVKTSYNMHAWCACNFLLFLGPPGPVSKLSCHFLTQDVVQVSYNEPQSLVGVETKYLIALPGLSANTITTDGNTVNVTLPNITALDFFKSYNITVTSFNSGSVGNTSSCTIFIPNGKCLRNYTHLLLYTSSDHYAATQIASSVISVVLVNNSKDAKINMTTELLDTKVLLIYCCI